MTRDAGRFLPDRTLSRSLAGPQGRDVVKIESLDVKAGHQVVVTFDAVGPRWRQGVFLATTGRLRVAGTLARAVVLWSDTSPTTVVVDVVETAGRVIAYNVWDSGRGKAPEAQSATSGMLVDELPDGGRRYACTDIGVEPDFGRLVFTLRVVGAAGRSPSGSTPPASSEATR